MLLFKRGRRPGWQKMSVITALETQKHNQERISVFLDGDFALGVPLIVAVRLWVGQSITPAELAALRQTALQEEAREKALQLLARRPRSVAEVRRALADKGYEEAIIAWVVTHLTEVQLLDDLAFARYWIEQRDAFRPRSRAFLRQELRQKGIALDIVEAVLGGDDEEWTRILKTAKQRATRYYNLPWETFQSKLEAYLQRRGFRYGLIRQAVAEVWQLYHDDESPDQEAF